ncbi:MAG TPA: protein-glutamate O-methyltransferase CheR [Stenomitos sp.]
MRDSTNQDLAGQIGRMLYQEAALAYPESKRSFVEERVRGVMADRGCSDEQTFVRSVEADPGLRTALIESLTIHETRFFRIPAQFEALGKLLPELAERRRRSPLECPRLRLWVAACSTGEDAYSLAMKVLALADPRWSAEIRATDLSRAVIRQAQAARYPAERLENLPPGYRERFFTELPGGLEVVPSVRELVRFEAHNLKAPCPPGPWDLILCRNVLIYFDNPFREALLERLYQALTPGGYLFVGEAETLHLVPHRFKPVEVGSALVYQRPL